MQAVKNTVAYDGYQQGFFCIQKKYSLSLWYTQKQTYNMGTFFSDPPVVWQRQVRQWLQALRYGLYRPAGQLSTGTDVKSLKARLVLYKNLHWVVGQLLTAVKTQFL